MPGSANRTVVTVPLEDSEDSAIIIPSQWDADDHRSRESSAFDRAATDRGQTVFPGSDRTATGGREPTSGAPAPGQI
jgi:hypothetical protein